MIESAKDILYIVLAFCVLWFTVFVCWGMYYMISMLRNMYKITAGVKDKLKTIDKILNLIKDKLEKGSDHMSVITDSVIKLVGLAMEKQKSSSRKKGKKK